MTHHVSVTRLILATRNAMPETLDSVLRLMESGAVETAPWITHQLGLGDVVEQFAGEPEP